MVRQYETIMDIELGQNRVVHNLNTNNIVVQCMLGNNLLNFETLRISNKEIDIISYYEGTLENVSVVVLGERQVRKLECSDEINYI